MGTRYNQCLDFLLGCCVLLITKRDKPKLGPQTLGNKRQHGEHTCSKHDNDMLLGQRAFLKKPSPNQGPVGGLWLGTCAIQTSKVTLAWFVASRIGSHKSKKGDHEGSIFFFHGSMGHVIKTPGTKPKTQNGFYKVCQTSVSPMPGPILWGRRRRTEKPRMRLGKQSTKIAAESEQGRACRSQHRRCMLIRILMIVDGELSGFVRLCSAGVRWVR